MLVTLNRKLRSQELGQFLSTLAHNNALPAMTLHGDLDKLVLDPQSTRAQVLSLIYELVHMGLIVLPN